ENGNGAPGIVGHQHVFAGRMHAQMRRSGPLRTDGVERREAPRRAIDGIGAHRTGTGALIGIGLIGGVEVGPGGIKGQPGRIGVVGEYLAQGEGARGRVHLKQIDALAVALAAFRSLRGTIGADVGQNGVRSARRESDSESRGALQETAAMNGDQLASSGMVKHLHLAIIAVTTDRINFTHRVEYRMRAELDQGPATMRRSAAYGWSRRTSRSTPEERPAESSSPYQFPSGGLDFIRLGGGVRDRFPVFPHSLHVQGYRLPHAALGKLQRSARCDTPRQVRNVGAVPGVGLGVDRGVFGVLHVICARTPGVHAVLGSTSRLTALPSWSSATSNSQDACMFIQNLEVVPKYRDRRSAVSAVMPRFSLTMPLMPVAGTRSAKANRCADIPRGDRNSSRRISPG